MTMKPRHKIVTAAILFVAAGLSTLVWAATPRSLPDQQVHYWRVSLASPICPGNAATCTINVGAVPYNSIILRVTAAVHTAFNSVTSDGVTLGTTSANANEIMSAALSIHTQGLASGTVLATASSATGNTATQTGANGGFDLWLKYTAVGTVATTGNAAIIIEYIPNNDGACAQVPASGTGSNPAGC
jgi:hypothetical protein